MDDIPLILSFARRFLPGEGLIQEMAEWNAGWRQEALEFYIPLGWSFFLKQEEVIQGFFLAQPLLFYRGHSQCLWLEEVIAANEGVRRQLVAVAYQLAREKHLQRLVMHNEEAVDHLVTDNKIFNHSSIEVATVKI